MRSRTRASSGPATADSSSARASPSSSPPTTSSGSPGRPLPLGARTARTIATDSAARRRATNASVCADARSSHCASSTRQTSGRSSADLGQQAEHRQADEEAVRCVAGRAARTPCRAHRAAGREPLQRGPGTGRRAGAARRTPAPSPTRPRRARATRQPGAAGAGTRAARSCRPPPRRAGRAPRSARAHRRHEPTERRALVRRPSSRARDQESPSPSPRLGTARRLGNLAAGAGSSGRDGQEIPARVFLGPAVHQRVDAERVHGGIQDPVGRGQRQHLQYVPTASVGSRDASAVTLSATSRMSTNTKTPTTSCAHSRQRGRGSAPPPVPLDTASSTSSTRRPATSAPRTGGSSDS